jgi:hypothetical protein
MTACGRSLLSDVYLINVSWGGSVSITSDYRLDDQGSGVRFLAGAGNFSLLHVQTSSGAYPESYPMSTGGAFPGVKRPGREADHSPPPSS